MSSNHGHHIATTDEEEQLALELAIAASMHDAGAPAGPVSSYQPHHLGNTSSSYPPVRAAEPQRPLTNTNTNSSSSNRNTQALYPGIPAAQPSHAQAPYAPPRIISQAMPNGGGFQVPPHMSTGSIRPQIHAPETNTPNAAVQPKPAPTSSSQPRHPPHPHQQQQQLRPQTPPLSQQPGPKPSAGQQPSPGRPLGSSLAAATAAAAAAAGDGLKKLLPGECAGCGAVVGFGSYVQALGHKWHHTCFRCAGCHLPIGSSGAFSYVPGDNSHPYHPECYRELHNPRCYVCQQLIPEQADGTIQWKENPFWRLPHCPAHLHDGSLQCCGCNKLQKQQEEWVRLQDGRPLCLECLDSIVVDTKDCQPLYDEVMSFYRAMGMPLPYKAPLILVEGQVLNDFSEREGGRPTGPVFHVRGLTLAEVYRSIPMVVQTGPSPPGSSRGGGGRGLLRSVSSVATSLGTAINNSTGRSTPTGVREHCSVTYILVLYGLPRLLMGSIIAHELLHAYLRMRHVTGLSEQVEEGLAQLMALLWLDSQDEEVKAAGNKHAERLMSYLGYQIRTDTSDTYGEGFRIAYEKFQQRGLRALVEYIVQHHSWPSWD